MFSSSDKYILKMLPDNQYIIKIPKTISNIASVLNDSFENSF